MDTVSKTEMPIPPQDNMDEKIARFKEDLSVLINKHSMENISDTPDFMLADFMVESMLVYGKTMKKRDKWYRPIGEDQHG